MTEKYELENVKSFVSMLEVGREIPVQCAYILFRLMLLCVYTNGCVCNSKGKIQRFSSQNGSSDQQASEFRGHWSHKGKGLSCCI